MFEHGGLAAPFGRSGWSLFPARRRSETSLAARTPPNAMPRCSTSQHRALRFGRELHLASRNDRGSRPAGQAR